MVNKEKAVKT